MVMTAVRSTLAACGIKVTLMVHEPSAGTGLEAGGIWQLSVSEKSPGSAPPIMIEVTVSGKLPMLLSTSCTGWLATPIAGLDEKAMLAGTAVASVIACWEVHSGACQMPRPYVAAISTWLGENADGVLNATAGAAGSPVPNTAQQLELLPLQLATSAV